MRIPPLLAAFLCLAAISSGADPSLVHVRRAQALLGTDVWSQIIHVENTTRKSRYPESLHALVFELAGILWFYSPVDGTQSFSLHRDRLAEEKANFAPLLRDIEPGFKCWRVVDTGLMLTSAVAPEAELPNGCFIESYANLRMLVARGVPVAEPRLLSFYGRASLRRQGHTVLAYSAGSKVAVVDPDRPEQKLTFPAAAAANPMKLARAVQGPEVQQARIIPLPLPTAAASRDVFAANQSANAETVF